MSPEYKTGIWRMGWRSLDWYNIKAKDDEQAKAEAKALSQTLEQPTEILSVINISNNERRVIYHFGMKEESKKNLLENP